MADFHALWVEVAQDAAELAEALLHAAGCAGLEVRDAETKPIPGQRAPAPGHALLLAYFEGTDVLQAARARAQAELPAAAIEVSRVPDEDWSESWKARVRAVSTERLWVGPPWLLGKKPPALVPVVIEPGMAFGTGDHPTTLACLEGLDRSLRARPGASVLDVGTGSGVLAIAACKLGAGRVVGTDNDPVAVRVARENARLNQAESIDLSEAGLEAVAGQFDLVVANILANALVALAPAIAGKMAPGAELYLAGILAEQAAEVEAAYAVQGLLPRARDLRGEWAMPAFDRPGASR